MVWLVVIVGFSCFLTKHNTSRFFNIPVLYFESALAYALIHLMDTATGLEPVYLRLCNFYFITITDGLFPGIRMLYRISYTVLYHCYYRKERPLLEGVKYLRRDLNP